uniref:DUF116 domain-containing protein n=2 Tax=Bursaphelenchus xylophilus TaxID=6326 RepID=A0A1I7SH46_BURXY
NCSQFIDGPRLVAAMGCRILTDENGKQKLVPLVELVAANNPPANAPNASGN